MKKITIILSFILLSGCSFIPKMSFDTPNTVPQETKKSKRKVLCKGEIILNQDGTIDSCTKNFYEYTENFDKQERKYTLKEKIINFFRNLTGNIFWLTLILIILCPSLIGLIFGRVFNGSNRALVQTVEAIKKFRKTSQAKEELDDCLREKQSKGTKILISKERKVRE